MNYADRILELLAAKHSKDVFVPECKSGPTYYSEHMRMDAWVMNRSWAHPCYTAYEIKISRSDFLNDKKWRAYLPYCNEFFFVAPKGIVKVDELPPEAGLLEQLGGVTGRRLVRRKQAAWRDVVPPESIFKYVLMARVKVGRSEYSIEQTKEERAADYRRFIQAKIENRELGYLVSKAIREKATAMDIEMKKMERQMAEYDDIRRLLVRLDIDPDSYVSRWTIEDRLKQQEEIFPLNTIWTIRRLRDDLNDALKKLEPKESLQEDAEALTA